MTGNGFRFVKVVGVSLAVTASSVVAQPADEAASRKVIVEGARIWAESVATGDTVQLERVLADDMRGVSPKGEAYDKADMLAGTRDAPKRYISNRLNDVDVRFFGSDFAVAQGSESWVRRDGSKGRFIWTDTWARRSGQWRIVAARDAEVLEK